MSSNATHLAELSPVDVALDIAHQIARCADNNSYFEEGSGLSYYATWNQASDLEVVARADDGATRAFYVTVRADR